MIKDLKATTIDGVATGYESPDGVSWETLEDYLCISVLNTCGCGAPSDMMDYVEEMLLKHVKQTDSDSTECWDNADYEDRATMFFLYWADHEGYTEHGTTIRCSWMTEKGDELLRDIQTARAEMASIKSGNGFSWGQMPSHPMVIDEIGGEPTEKGWAWLRERVAEK